MIKDNCSDCGKEEGIYDLIQVKDKYPKRPKYKLICKDCWRTPDREYEYIGQLRRIVTHNSGFMTKKI